MKINKKKTFNLLLSIELEFKFDNSVFDLLVYYHMYMYTYTSS